jgi:two-component system NarL family sensor kinase
MNIGLRASFRNWPHNMVVQPSLCGYSISLGVCLFFFLALTCSCGDKKTGHPPIHRLPVDTARLDTLLEHAWFWQQKQPDSCRFYALAALKQARAWQIKKSEAEAYCRLGYLEETAGRFDSAILCYNSALALDSAVHYAHGYARDCNHLGIILKNKGNYSLALEYMKVADSIWSRLPGKEIESCAAKINAGNIYMRMGQTDLALHKFEEALSTGERKNNLKLQADALNSIGLVYEEQQALKRASQSYQQALGVEEKRENEKGIATECNNIGNICYKLGQFEEALQWLKKSLALKEKLGQEKSKANTLMNIGLVYQSMNDNPRALDYFLQSYTIQSASGDPQETAICADNLGETYHRMKRSAESKKYLEEALRLSRQSGSKTVELEVLGHLSSLLADGKEYAEAFRYANGLRHLRDTIEQNMLHAAETDALYLEESHRRKLVEKEKEKQYADLQRKRAENRQQEITVYALAVGILLLLLLSAAFWRILRERHRAQLAEHQEKINRQQAEELIRNQELSLLRSILDAREKERQRIAKDLHDRLGLKLSTARLYLNALDKNLNQLPEEIRNQYISGSKILDESFIELRKVAHNLASGELIRFGLSEAILRLCETITLTGKINIRFYNSGMDIRLDSSSEFQLYQVIQELLSNILRHSEATEATVQLTRFNDTLNILVEDNGCGFAMETEKQNQGIGLRSVHERVTQLNGTVVIDSRLKHGTTISIDIHIP